jgi:hypothetical protein
VAFLADLAAGTLGVRVVPPRLTVVEDNPDHARLRDDQFGLSWLLTFNHALHLDLGMDCWNELVRDTRRQTRALFESMIQRDRWPRLDDPEHSPLIECERFVLPGGAGLTVLFRTHCEPGLETITGHTLVPTAHGLFHARWVSAARDTGGRESVLAAEAHLQGRGTPTLDFFDAAVHDARFPRHVLSLARSVKLWWRDRLELTAPPPPPTRGEVALPELGCAVTLPPRFARYEIAHHAFGAAAYFNRSSFSSLDGIDKLQIARFREPLGHLQLTQLFAHMFEVARADATEFTQNLEDVTFTADKGRPYQDPWLPSIVAVAEGTRPGYPRSRLVWEWSFAERTYQLWKVLLWTTTAIPVAELRHTVQAVRDSLRC